MVSLNHNTNLTESDADEAGGVISQGKSTSLDGAAQITLAGTENTIKEINQCVFDVFIFGLFLHKNGQKGQK